MEKRKKGRPATGQKKYKTISFRVSEETYELYDEISKDKYGISIHTFLKRNIDKILDNDFIVKRDSLLINNAKKIEKENKKLKKTISDIESLVGGLINDSRN